jgi:hypothetical protein
MLTTQLYSPSAVYCITPTTEEIARAVAAQNQPSPVHLFELRQLQGPREEAEEGNIDRDDLGYNPFGDWQLSHQGWPAGWKLAAVPGALALGLFGVFLHREQIAHVAVKEIAKWLDYITRILIKFVFGQRIDGIPTDAKFFRQATLWNPPTSARLLVVPSDQHIKIASHFSHASFVH